MSETKTMPEAVEYKEFWLSGLNVNTGNQEIRIALTFLPNSKIIGEHIHVITYDAYSALRAECERLKNLEIESLQYASELRNENAALVAENADFRTALEFYSDDKSWKESDTGVEILDTDTELSDYVNQLGSKCYGGKLARETLRKHDKKEST